MNRVCELKFKYGYLICMYNKLHAGGKVDKQNNNNKSPRNQYNEPNETTIRGIYCLNICTLIRG